MSAKNQLNCNHNFPEANFRKSNFLGYIFINIFLFRSIFFNFTSHAFFIVFFFSFLTIFFK